MWHKLDRLEIYSTNPWLHLRLNHLTKYPILKHRRYRYHFSLQAPIPQNMPRLTRSTSAQQPCLQTFTIRSCHYFSDKQRWRPVWITEISHPLSLYKPHLPGPCCCCCASPSPPPSPNPVPLCPRPPADWPRFSPPPPPRDRPGNDKHLRQDNLGSTLILRMHRFT